MGNSVIRKTCKSKNIDWEQKRVRINKSSLYVKVSLYQTNKQMLGKMIPTYYYTMQAKQQITGWKKDLLNVLFLYLLKQE